jgi:hypothetical protein
MLKLLVSILRPPTRRRFALDQTCLYLNTCWLTLRFEIRHRLSAESLYAASRESLACRLLRSIVAEQESRLMLPPRSFCTFQFPGLRPRLCLALSLRDSLTVFQ